MTTVEELQSMTHEDLVRRVQELEQDLKEVKEQSDMWLDSPAYRHDTKAALML
mgnify:CR=1 FL=1